MPADWTSGVEEALRALAKTLKTAFWIPAVADGVAGSPSDEGLGLRRVGCVVRMSDRMCRDVTWRASWPLLKQWRKRLRFSSANVW